MDKDEFKDYPRLRPNLHPVHHTLGDYSLVFVKTFLSSSLAELFIFSLGIPKPRLQLSNTEGGGTATACIGHPMRDLVRADGLRTINGALSAMIIRNLIFNAPRIYLYEIIHQRITHADKSNKLGVLPSFMASATAGSTAQMLNSPLENVQQRMRLEARRGLPGQTMRSIEYIYKRGGIKSFWNGVGPGSLHAILLTAGDTACYDLSKRLFIRSLNANDGLSVQFMASLVSGMIATILSTPANMVKSIYLNQPTYSRGYGMLYRNTMDCVYKCILTKGFLTATYRNLLPTWIRIGPWNVFFWLTYEQMLRSRSQRRF